MTSDGDVIRGLEASRSVGFAKWFAEVERSRQLDAERWRAMVHLARVATAVTTSDAVLLFHADDPVAHRAEEALAWLEVRRGGPEAIDVAVYGPDGLDRSWEEA